MNEKKKKKKKTHTHTHTHTHTRGNMKTFVKCSHRQLCVLLTKSDRHDHKCHVVLNIQNGRFDPKKSKRRKVITINFCTVICVRAIDSFESGRTYFSIIVHLNMLRRNT